jgi:predicted peroxiredoxin
MPKLVIEISHSPFGHENAYAALFAAMAWVSMGDEVVVLLRGRAFTQGGRGSWIPSRISTCHPPRSR